MDEVAEAVANPPNPGTKTLVKELIRHLTKLADLTSNEDDRVETLETELRQFKVSLKDSYAIINRENSTSVQVNKGIIKAVYNMEDAIDVLKTQISDIKKHRNPAVKFLKKRKLQNLVKRVEVIIKDVEDLKELAQRIEQPKTSQMEPTNKVETLQMDPKNEGETLQMDPKNKGETSLQMEPKNKTPGDDIVGLYETELKTIISCLKEEKDCLDVIHVIGRPGVGKTTLARTAFCHPEFLQSYHRIWVNVPHKGYKRRDVFLDILSHLPSVTEDMKLQDEDVISNTIRNHLIKLDRFFIVMDGVESEEALTDLLVSAFPFATSYKKWKILVTSQLEEEDRWKCITRGPIQLVSTSQQRETLQKKFRNEAPTDDDMVRLSEQALLQIISYIDTWRFHVIPIIGRPGVGKTTLARNLFCSPRFSRDYDRIWVNVKNRNKDDVLLHILRQLTYVTDNMIPQQDYNISQTIQEHLKILDMRFLIVIDDVGSKEVWTDLLGAFPKTHNKGAILLISQTEEAASSHNITTGRGTMLLEFKGRARWCIINGLTILLSRNRDPRDDMVGLFERELEAIINYIEKDTYQLDVIPIIGMPGVGKSTLAGNLFFSPRIISDYHRIWVNVPPLQKNQKDDALLHVLRQLTDDTETMKHQDYNISGHILALLTSLDRFLIVIDDVRNEEMWTHLLGAFPKFHKNGKILLITQLVEVSRWLNITREPIRLELQHQHCWCKIKGRPVHLGLQHQQPRTVQMEHSRNEASREDMVGLSEKELERIIYYIEEETRQLDVIRITGTRGVGKTTFASNLFCSPRIISAYHRIWVNVPPLQKNQQKDDVLLHILRQLTYVTENMKHQDYNISQTIQDHLRALKRFLIVIDDVGSEEVWTDLLGAFPIDHKNGKILLISDRLDITGKHIRLEFSDCKRWYYIGRECIPLGFLGTLQMEHSWNEAPTGDMVRLPKRELETIIDYIEEAEMQQLDVIPIIGRPGVGKTTLAHNLFWSPKIIDDYHRIWVNVPPLQKKQKKDDVLLHLLSQLTYVTDNMNHQDYNISKIIQEHLRKLDSFFIVIDDVGSEEVWTDLLGAFPEDHENGKVLLITQLVEAASWNNINTEPIQLEFQHQHCWCKIKYRRPVHLRLPHQQARTAQMEHGRDETSTSPQTTEGADTLFLLEKLKWVLQSRCRWIMNADDQAEHMENNLQLLERILEGNSAIIQKKSATLREVNMQIKHMVDEIDETICNYQAKKHKRSITRFTKAPTKLIDVAKTVDAISKTIRYIKDLVVHASWETESGEELEQMIKSPWVSTDKVHMVGFEETKVRIINYLEEETVKIDVISIIGMPGIGKTRLAYEIFNNRKMKSRLGDHCIWVNVLHKYQKKDMLLSILSNFIDITNDVRLQTDIDISQMVKEHLYKSDRFLIVMDDVWGAKAWVDLEEAFPKDHKAGKILITSQLKEIGHGANITRDPIQLGPLNLEHSWQLLQSEVFENKSQCPPELEPFGQLIAQKCDGLPVLIVMVGKFLKKKYLHGDMLEMQHTWERMSANLSRFINEMDLQNTNTSFYDKLPYHLRLCFLYTGIFPEGFEIPIRTLIRLWVAEGFIHKMEGRTPEEIALDYFKELISRNLLMVGKMDPSRTHIKTCRVHYMLWEFCRKEATSEKENLFHEIEYIGENVYEPSISNITKYSRLSIESNVNGVLSSHPFCPQVQSVLCFSKEDLQPDNISSIPDVLRSLQVLEAKPITITKLPGDWRKLALLRYIVVSINFRVLPKVISKLQNMQTFVVYTTYRKLEMKANIWKMSKLRHMETNVSTKLPRQKGGKGNQLQTLGMISDKSCGEDFFGQLHNLHKLGICGRLNKLVKSKGLKKLDKLEKLKLVNDLSADGVVQQLPSNFPPYLRSLTLYATNLDWSHMSKLRDLDTLKVLKLKDNAFKGDSWEASTGGFCQLQVLHIEHNDLSIWIAFADSFPRLETLILTNCRRLKGIPLSLKKSLQNLDLKGVKDAVVTSAWRIKQAKKDLSLKIYTSGNECVCG